MNGVYGFSIKMGTGGKPEVNSFGNVKKSQNGPVVDEVREPMVDIFEEDDEIQIVAEMPGVAKNNIKLELNGDVMVIRAENNKRKYYKELLLPARVKEDTLNYSYKNGILEVKLAKHS
jgi:HSP20 family protein